MWNQITLDVPEDLLDAIVGDLAEHDAAGAWEGEVGDSGSASLVLYFGLRANLDAVAQSIHAVFQRSGYPLPTLRNTVVEDCDWTGEWKKSYSSFPIGSDFFVIPSWVETRCPADRMPIRIDPGQAFGTGTHETTQLTIEALERWVEPAHVVLDVGTGSGILALAARLLGVRQVFACDLDPVAVEVALSNIARNQQPGIATFCGSIDAVRAGGVNFLLANLTADVIFDLFPEFDRVLPVSGIAVFSGALQTQRERVHDACRERGFVIHEEITRGEWLTLVTEKHGH